MDTAICLLIVGDVSLVGRLPSISRNRREHALQGLTRSQTVAYGWSIWAKGRDGSEVGMMGTHRSVSVERLFMCENGIWVGMVMRMFGAPG